MSQFEFLKTNRRLYNSMTAVEERINAQDWDVAVQKMRTAVQTLVSEIYGLYRVMPQGTMEEQINRLKEAELICPETVAAFHEIRIKGNKASHENAGFGEDCAVKLYACLVAEMLLFTEKYSKEPDPRGAQRLQKTSGTGGASVPKQKHRNYLLPASLVRIIGLLQIGFAVFWIKEYLEKFSDPFFANSRPMFIIAGVAVILSGLYSLLTGHDNLLILSFLFGR